MHKAQHCIKIKIKVQIKPQINDDDPQDALPPLNPFMLNAPLAQAVPQRPQLNWSHFKPEYAGKPDQRCRSKHIYLGGMTGWTHTNFWIKLRYRDFV